MAGGRAPIQIEGYKDFQRDLRRESKDLPKAIGRTHKEVGKFIISKIEPKLVPASVGEGAGSMVRASATKRDLLLLVGGSHRAARAQENKTAVKPQQWGKHEVWPKVANKRPYIIGTALDHEDEIRQRLLDGIVKQLSPAFAEAE